MKSLQDYIDTFKGIATKLNLTGDSVEVLVQMLANASYISEVENITYAQESSLEKAVGINSKIQLCMDNMYSVFRGACPRVIMQIKPTAYKSFEMFDKIISSNGLDVYYLGYYSPGSDGVSSSGSKTFQTIKDFVYSPLTVSPAIMDDEVYTIVGLLAQKVVDIDWTLGADNIYYVDCIDSNLSNDLWVRIEDKYYEVTREFSNHILEGSIFDLTLPSFGSRLFINEIFRNDDYRLKRDTTSTAVPNTKITARYFVFSSLDEYNKSSLNNQIKLKGTQLVPFSTDFLAKYSFEEAAPGVILIDSTGRDDLGTIHYKASRDRFVNSVIRSNSDIGVVLEEMFPDKIKTGGTTYDFFTGLDGSRITIYYVPLNQSNPLTETEIQNFIDNRAAYYITDIISILPGTQYTAVFNIDLEIYQNQKVDSEVDKILQNYVGFFNVNFKESMEDIRAQINKIDNVKKIRDLSITYVSSDGGILTDERVANLNLSQCYFVVETNINTVVN